MNIIIFIKQGIRSIVSNKLRSFLSTLWIIIGIASFVIMLSLWEWAKASILQDFGWSNKVINVTSKVVEGSIAKNVITEEIAKQIPLKVPHIERAYVQTSGGFQISYNQIDISANLLAVQKGYMEYKEMKLEYGNWFTRNDYAENKKIVILGNKLIRNAFKDENPIGKTITISGESFIVWGLLKKKSWETDYNIFIPYTTGKEILNMKKISSIEVVVGDEKKLDQAKKNLGTYLLKKSETNKTSKVLFELRTNVEALKQVNDIIWKMNLLLWGIGAIALVVWGIGIMNIMLVSVTERTREIGIRKAIWATNMNILFQFLIESIILTCIGAIVAILLSYWVVAVIGNLIPDFTPIISSKIIFIATGVSISMWMLFGIMPANKAARLKPIDALSFE